VRLAYLGTPEMAVPPLEALVAAGHEVATVVTRADTRRGRGGSTSPSPVKAAAEQLGLPVAHQVDEIVDVARERPIDLGVVVAFGQIIRPHVLAVVPMVNLHVSLLPRWRGAAPIERAILAGDEVTGVCLMAVEEGLDTGGVYGRVDMPIGRATADELRTSLVAAGTHLLLDRLADGLGEPEPQRGPATYAAKISPEELRIDWSRPAVEIDRLVRVGGAWTTFRGRRVKITDGELDHDRFLPAEVRPEGKPAMTFDAWMNGARPAPGEWFE
jgi:methionyl-tRNA formyltransferase